MTLALKLQPHGIVLVFGVDGRSICRGKIEPLYPSLNWKPVRPKQVAGLLQNQSVNAPRSRAERLPEER